MSEETKAPTGNGRNGQGLLGKLDPATAVIFILLTGGGSAGLNALLPGARADPFTGKDGKALKAELRGEYNKLISEVESRCNVKIAELRGAQKSHEAYSRTTVSAYDKEIAYLRARYEDIHEELDRER